ncbi:MAG: hypothetical protein PWQ32_706, partial [Thermococcaceae archaeon]|nr:hypothetical protein [Thermococcaceae archaeon]
MNKKTLSVFVMLLMVLSVVPAGFAFAESSQNNIQVSVKSTKVSTSENTKSSENPDEKIDTQLLAVLEGKESQGVVEVGGQKILLTHIIAKGDITSKLQNVEILGKTKILNSYVYIARIPVKPSSKTILRKIASIPEVEAITLTNPVKPLEIQKDNDVSYESITLPRSKFADRVKNWAPKESLNGKNVLSFRDMISGKLKALRENSPAFNGETKLAVPKVEVKETPKPADYFAIYHHGAWNTWFDLGITGKGINVAVIDSGVDFGNPDLQDAYAVDTNPNSPYYGWPIAFDGNSMIYYLLFGYTFADFATFSGYLYSWYADTSYPIEPFPVYGYFGIGYKGNYTTVFTSMSLANIPDDTERSQLVENVLTWIGNVSNVLLVDDDGGDILEIFYIESLDSLGV